MSKFNKRARIAYFSPLNPQRSGISDYSEELLPALGELLDIDLFVAGFAPANQEIAEQFQVIDYQQNPDALARLGNYDALVCQMGNNSRYHSAIYEVAKNHRSIVVFHDFALQHFFLERARELHDPKIYLDELELSHGRASRDAAADAMAAGIAPPQYHDPAAFPMNYRLANQAEGIIVHSDWSRSRLSRIARSVPIKKINHHVKLSADALRRDNSREPLTIASFGFITPHKGIDAAIRALAALKSDHRFRYNLIGEKVAYFDIDELIRQYEMRDRVIISGYLNFAEFKQRIAATDIAINLRDQTVGETSGSLCRLLAAGVPTLVSNIGWYSELPDDCVIKIEPGPGSDLMIAVFLKQLIENSELRRRIGENARRYIREHHSLSQTANDYAAFVDEVIAMRARRAFIDSVAADIARLSNGEPDELLMRAVAPELAELV